MHRVHGAGLRVGGGGEHNVQDGRFTQGVQDAHKVYNKVDERIMYMLSRVLLLL